MYHLRTIFIKLKKKNHFLPWRLFSYQWHWPWTGRFFTFKLSILKRISKITNKKNYLLFLVFNNIICAFLNRIKIKFILLFNSNVLLITKEHFLNAIFALVYLNFFKCFDSNFMSYYFEHIKT